MCLANFIAKYSTLLLFDYSSYLQSFIDKDLCLFVYELHIIFSFDLYALVR